jgi:hypothetical protein
MNSFFSSYNTKGNSPNPEDQTTFGQYQPQNYSQNQQSKKVRQEIPSL